MSYSIASALFLYSYVHNQIISVLTASALTRMFEKRRNYDFRHLLGGTERLLDNLLNMLDYHPSFLLGGVQCLPLATSIRETITQTIIQYCSKIKVSCIHQVQNKPRFSSHYHFQPSLLPSCLNSFITPTTYTLNKYN